MIVLKAPTEAIKKTIESQTSGSHLIRFAEDANANFILGKEVLTDPVFVNIDFSQLVEIEYAPILEVT